jgi:hypothetical protein
MRNKTDNPKRSTGLNARDEKFVDKVALGEPATKAYVDAGFKNTKNARINAKQKLTTPNIQSALEKRKAEYRAIADVEAKDIIGAQQEIAFASIEDALDDDGYINFPKAKQNGAAKLIKKISRTPNKYGEAVSVEFYSRSDALNQLADILGIKQQPKENETDIHAVITRCIEKMTAKGHTREQQIEAIRETFGEVDVPVIG